MTRSLLPIVLVLLLPGCGDGGHSSLPQRDSGTPYVFSRAPLAPVPYATLPLGAVKPEGWLRDQLERMANGMTGHLDEWYPTVGASNGWLGGDGDVWERGPYWLDGLVPLAYLLDDQRLKDKARPYIEWTLASQDSTGYFGPRPEPPGTQNRPQQQRTNASDWWPRMVVLKVLQQHYEATGDERVLPFMTKYFRYQLEHLDEQPLDKWTGWGKARGGENQATVLWLYDRTGDKFLLDLAQKLFDQTLDWTGAFEDGMTVTDYWPTHVVNVAMGIKQPAQQYLLTGDQRYLRAIHTGLAALMAKHGQAVGMFSGDERLHNTDPVHGIELCAVVEFMLSLENLMVIAADVPMIDRLERVAYNALPTQVTDDQKDRQYFQQVNQIRLSIADKGLFIDAYQDAGCFGLLTGYACCTTNLHQGWPKLTRHAWLATEDGGLAALVYAPTSVEAEVRGGKVVRIVEETNYPFEDVIRLRFDQADRAFFPLHVRIPEWATDPSVTVNGTLVDSHGPGTITIINRTWSTDDVVEIHLPSAVRLEREHENGLSVSRGPLLYALPVAGRSRDVPAINAGSNKNTVISVEPTSPWNYGLVQNRANPIADFHFEATPMTATYPWNEANVPLRIVTNAVRIPNWHEYNEAAGPPPPSPVWMRGAETEQIALVPYGATTLRVAVFPEVVVE